MVRKNGLKSTSAKWQMPGVLLVNPLIPLIYMSCSIGEGWIIIGVMSLCAIAETIERLAVTLV